MAYFWPLILVVASNTVYHICAKSLPESEIGRAHV